MQDICIMGLGYIGLPTAGVLAQHGYNVWGVDVKPAVVDTINRGEIHIIEPDLDSVIKQAVSSGKLKAGLSPRESDIFIVAVPTPFRENKQPDLRYVESATKSIAPYLRSGNLIILESTSPVGTTETMERIVREMRPELFTNDSNLLFAHCPERVLPGQILHEIVQNDRVVGGVDSESTVSAADFYRSFVQGKVIETSCRAAELTKLVENSFRDTNIAFANELSLICDELEIDVWEVIALANRHPRVNILRPGPGVGGHCLAVDPWFIVSAAPQTARLIRNAREVNEGKPDWVIQRTLQHAQKLKQPKVGCLGLSYKPNIDDLRESPALHIARELVTRLPPHSVFACEPHITSLEGIELRTLEETLASADILIGLVAHDHFRDISPKAFNGKLVLDICGMFR